MFIEYTTGLPHKINFFMFMVRCFFLLSHFLVVEDYELSKSTSYLYKCVINPNKAGLFECSFFWEVNPFIFQELPI